MTCGITRTIIFYLECVCVCVCVVVLRCIFFWLSYIDVLFEILFLKKVVISAAVVYLLKSMPAIKKLPFFFNNVLFFKQGVHLDLIIFPVFEKQLSWRHKRISKKNPYHMRRNVWQGCLVSVLIYNIFIYKTTRNFIH